MNNLYFRKQYFPHEGEVAGAVTFSEPQNPKKENKISLFIK